MNLLSDQATIERIGQLQAEIGMLRAESYVRLQIPVPLRAGPMRGIVRACAVMFGVTEAEILGETRVRKVCQARFAAMHTAMLVHGFSSVRVGRDLGGRDHSTVLSAMKTIAKWRAADEVYREQTDRLVVMFTPKLTEEADDGPSCH